MLASAVPISSFIGGAGFVTLGEVFVPVMAVMLKPKAALLAGLVGTFVVYALQLATAPVYGPVSIVIPVAGIFLGSLAVHTRLGKFVAWAYVLFGAAFYAVFSGGTLAWLAPYILVAVTLPLVLVVTRWRFPLLCLYASMCELATMTIASITLLSLHGPVWAVITPFMFFERSVATGGAILVLSGLKKAMPNLIGSDMNV